MLWRRLLIRHGWALIVGEIARSNRWPAETRFCFLALAGVVYSLTVFPVLGAVYVYWLMTGRGPWRRLGFSRQIVVGPPTQGQRLLEILGHDVKPKPHRRWRR